MTDLIRSAGLSYYPEVARSVGLDPKQMMRKVRLPLAVLDKPDTPIAVASLRRLLELSAELSGAEDFGLRGGFESNVKGSLGFGASHGGFTREVASGPADAHIDDDGFDPRVAAKHVDRGASGAEIRDHLPRYFGRVRADAFFDDAVIGAEDQHGFARDARRFRLLDQR